jgi:hypothetical protein
MWSPESESTHPVVGEEKVGRSEFLEGVSQLPAHFGPESARPVPTAAHRGAAYVRSHRAPAQCPRRFADLLPLQRPGPTRAVCSTNAIERRSREVRRRTRPMGSFQDKTSMDRTLSAASLLKCSQASVLWSC